MIEHRWINCQDFNRFPDKPDCCSSCHYEWDDGFGEPLEQTCDDHEGVTAMVCCAVSAWIDGLTPDQWSAAIRAHDVRIETPPEEKPTG